MIKLQFANDGRNRDQDFIVWAEKAFAAAGISQQQAESIASAWQAHMDEWLQADAIRAEAAAETAVADLKKALGSDLDAHVKNGRAAVASLGLDTKALDALDRTIGAAATMNLLAKIGSRTATDAGSGKTTITVLDPAAAREEIARLSGDRAFQDALRDTKNSTSRADALAKWQDLHAAAYPGPEAPAAPAPTPTPAPAAGTRTRREAALARIDQLRADQGFQDRMRQPGPNREAAVQEWNTLHQEAYAPDDSA